jgi:uncharacterized membrane-anchored protein YitT (DUF2179 family)
MPLLSRRQAALLTALCLVAGNGLLAFLVVAFIMPHGIIMGGTTGIGIALQQAFPTLDVAVVVLVLNVALLLFGRAVLGRKFFLTTVASSLLYPAELALVQRIPGISDICDDATLAAIFAGCLMGIALGLVMRVGSSTGGTDVVSLVLHKWLHLPVSAMVYVTDAVVMGIQILTCTPKQMLLGLLVLLLETMVLDRAMILGNAQMQLTIFSERYERIRHALLSDAQVGATMLLAESGQLRRPGKAIICVVAPRRLYEVTELVCAVDPHAFIAIAQINEVRGQGFTSERIYLPEVEEGEGQE